MDNALEHTSIDALAFYGEQNFNLLAHPAYSPNLAPCNFWACPALKKKMKGTKYWTVNDVQQEVCQILRATPQEEFKQAIYDMPIHWSKCCSAAGEYFGGTNHTYDPNDLPPESAEESTESSEDDD